jgi:hypothetical protein
MERFGFLCASVHADIFASPSRRGEDEGEGFWTRVLAAYTLTLPLSRARRPGQILYRNRISLVGAPALKLWSKFHI